MVDLLDSQMQAWRRRMLLQAALSRALRALVVIAPLAGCVILLLRIAGPPWAGLAWPMLVAVLLLPVLAVPAALRRRPSTARVAAELDRHCRAEGLILALAEQPAAARDPAWLGRCRLALESLRYPSLRWPSGRAALVGVMVALGMVLVPLPEPEVEERVVWEPLFRRLDERLQSPLTSSLVADDRVQALRQRLQDLQQRIASEGMRPGAWEAIDRLERELRQDEERGLQALRQAWQQAGRVASAEAEATAQQSERLARALAQLAVQAPGLLPTLAPESEDGRRLLQMLARAKAGGSLSETQLRALQEAGLQVGAMGGRDLRLDPVQMRLLAQRLAEHLRQRGQALAQGGFEQQGGPGHDENERPRQADLNFSHQTDLEAAAAAGLPEGARLNADGTITLATSARAAEIDAASTRALLRARQQAFDPAAADARSVSVPPRHRASVAAYFQHSSPPAP